MAVILAIILAACAFFPAAPPAADAVPAPAVTEAQSKPVTARVMVPRGQVRLIMAGAGTVLLLSAVGPLLFRRRKKEPPEKHLTPAQLTYAIARMEAEQQASRERLNAAEDELQRKTLSLLGYGDAIALLEAAREGRL